MCAQNRVLAARTSLTPHRPQEVFVASGAFELPAGSFTAQVLSYLGGSNSETFALAYMETASTFLTSLENHQGPIQSKAS